MGIAQYTAALFRLLVFNRRCTCTILTSICHSVGLSGSFKGDQVIFINSMKVKSQCQQTFSVVITARSCPYADVCKEWSVLKYWNTHAHTQIHVHSTYFFAKYQISGLQKNCSPIRFPLICYHSLSQFIFYKWWSSCATAHAFSASFLSLSSLFPPQ